MSDSPVKTWYAVDIVIAPEAVEAAEFGLNLLDALGIEIDSLRKPEGEPLRVSGYFEQLPDVELARIAVADAIDFEDFAPDSLKSITTRQVEQTDWLAEWKKHWKPTSVGKFIITPPWETVADTDKIVISIEPNMAFGTGTHESTQLCLQAIGDNYERGETFLDVGTGTGILAIAVAKLSGDSNVKIVACDTDLDSVNIARGNAILNGVADSIEFYEGSLDSESAKFDFVCANLTIDVIVPIIELLMVKTNHKLLLSGILNEQTTQITTALTKFQISNFELERSGEWISILVTLD